MSTPYSLTNWGPTDGVALDAVGPRQLNASLFTKAGVTGNLACRGGILPGSGEALNISPSSGMTLAVEQGQCVVPSTATTNGAWVGYVPSGATITLTAANPTYARYDRVCVEVTELGTSSSTMKVSVVDGTPSASPVIPSAPSDSITLAVVYVGAGVTSISAGNITDYRDVTVAAGGVVKINGVGNLPAGGPTAQYCHDIVTDNLWTYIAGTNYPFRAPFVCTSTTRPTNKKTGTIIFETDTLRLNMWNGTAWSWPFARGNVGGEYSTDVTNNTAGTETLTNLLTPSISLEANRLYSVRVKLKYAQGSDASEYVLRLRETNGGGTLLDESLIPKESYNASYSKDFHMEYLYRPTSDVSKIYCLTHTRVTGTGELFCNAGHIVVDDLGPNKMTVA